MARRPRTALGGLAYHVMNRSSGNLVLFEDDGDYAGWVRCTAVTLVLESTLMPVGRPNRRPKP